MPGGRNEESALLEGSNETWFIKLVLAMSIADEPNKNKNLIEIFNTKTDFT
jgi:hypothetical protein